MSSAREGDPGGEPRTIDGYRLEARLGEGGSSEVFRAWDTKRERAVALKLSRGDRAELLAREAAVLARLDSPHTVRIHGSGTSDGTTYLVMDYLAGADLASIVRCHGALPAARALHFGAQACLALAHVHARGVAHGDVKPRNFVVSRAEAHHDFLTLVDFGIARSEDEDDAVPKRLRGTPAYLAPELVLGARATARSDLYALGATLYYLATGAPPFEGDEASILEGHLAHPPERPSQRLGRPLPRDFEETILACLAKDPSERPRDASALRGLLLACADANGWSDADARAFWTSARPEMLARWEAPTLG